MRHTRGSFAASFALIAAKVESRTTKIENSRRLRSLMRECTSRNAQSIRRVKKNASFIRMESIVSGKKESPEIELVKMSMDRKQGDCFYCLHMNGVHGAS